jgi:hypothetical protein
MGKLTKHAEVLTQLHSLVKKQAEEAQKNISGVPGGDVKSESIKDENDTTNKNSVGPENLAQGYSQKPSSDPSEPVASAKTAETLGSEILELIRKHADAQDTVSGEPGKDTNPEKIDEKNETTNKNEVGPEKNTPQTTGEQKESKDESKPVAAAKSASETEVDELAAKVASYELGRQFCAALLKAASAGEEQDKQSLAKEAGRRDLDLLIAQAAQDLTPEQEKQAEAEGAAYFEELLKQAALDQAVEENNALKAKLAEIESAESAEKQAQEQAAAQADLAEKVAAIVLEKLKAAAQE